MGALNGVAVATLPLQPFSRAPSGEGGGSEADAPELFIRLLRPPTTASSLIFFEAIGISVGRQA